MFYLLTLSVLSLPNDNKCIKKSYNPIMFIGSNILYCRESRTYKQWVNNKISCIDQHMCFSEVINFTQFPENESSKFKEIWVTYYMQDVILDISNNYSHTANHVLHQISTLYTHPIIFPTKKLTILICCHMTTMGTEGIFQHKDLNASQIHWHLIFWCKYNTIAPHGG